MSLLAWYDNDDIIGFCIYLVIIMYPKWGYQAT